MRRFAIAGVGALSLLAAAHPAGCQQTPPPSQTSTDTSFQCQHPADPRRRQSGCNDHEFTLDETLAGGWGKVRQEMQRIGITPTASYVGGLQTNVTGGRDQVWSYAGQLSFGFSADLNELIHARGLSAYAEVSWGTGSNLAGSVGSVIDTSGLYAPSFYLGEMYLQQKLMKDRVTVLAGRLEAGNTFAELPVFGNYVNYGINPSPISLGDQ
jgi:carbohydrate-selective porin OprB